MGNQYAHWPDEALMKSILINNPDTALHKEAVRRGLVGDEVRHGFKSTDFDGATGNPPEEVKHNVFDNPETHITYLDLTATISFEGFDPDHFRADEVRLLEPRLLEKGYRVSHWQDYGINYLASSFGRACKTVDQDGTIVWFMYE